MSHASNKINRNLFKNTYVKTIRNIILMVQGIVIAPLVISVLGMKGAGIWFLITQFSAYVQLMELGIPSGLTRLYSHYKALNDEKNLFNVVSVSLILLFSVSFSLLFFLNEINLQFFYLFSIEQNEKVDTAVLVALMFVSISLPFRCGIAMLSANHLFYVHLWIEIVFLVARLITLLLLSLFNVLDILILSVTYFSAVFFISLFQFLICLKNKYIGFVYNNFKTSISNFKKILSVSFSVMVITASATTLRQGSPMILGMFDGVDKVAMFSIAMLLVTTLMQFITIPVSFIGPQASQLNAINEKQKLYTTFLFYSMYSLMISTIGVILFYFFGELMLGLWLNIEQESIESIYHLTLIMIIIFSVSVPALYARTILSYINKHIITSTFELFVVLIGLLIGYINIKIFGLGMLGMAYGISSVFLLRAVGPIIFIFSKYFGISKLRYIQDVYKKNAIVVILALTGIIILDDKSTIFFLDVLVFLVCITVLQWFFIIDLVHRKKIQVSITLFIKNQIMNK